VPYIKADELHAIGRMNGLGNYVREPVVVDVSSPLEKR
jgi:hypothetical protein